MYAGPGAGPLLAAASAWNGLAGELHSSAASFLSVTQDLAGGSWLGPSAAAMMAVSAQYAGFLRTAAAQAEQAAGQAAATASAFEAALASTVQPAVVTANRGLVQLLAATNWLGQNAPAIMDIEAAYEQMWALDVAAMAGYHFDASAAAQRLAPWQRLLHNIGLDHAYHNAHSRGGVAPVGGASAGSGGNMGPGNAGSQNLSYANTGSNNIGFGNYGNSNVGFGNTGSWDIGFGLTGDHQIGFGGFNSGSDNIGFGNSGTENISIFDSGTGNVSIGNSGSFNTGMWNSGTAGVGMPPGIWNGTAAESGLAASNVDASLLGPGNYVTGGFGVANFGSGLLNSAAANTGGLTL
jgi:PPE-repeat protein